MPSSRRGEGRLYSAGEVARPGIRRRRRRGPLRRSGASVGRSSRKRRASGGRRAFLGEVGEQLAERGRELERVADAGRPDHDRPAAVDHEQLVGHERDRPGLVVQRRRVEAGEVLAHALHQRELVLAVVRPHLRLFPERHRIGGRPAELEPLAGLGHAVDAVPVCALHQPGPRLPALVAAAEGRDLREPCLQRQAQAERNEQRQRPRSGAHDGDVRVDAPAAREGAHAIALRRERDALLVLVDGRSRGHRQPHLHLDRAPRQDHGAVGLEDRRRVGLRAHLREQPRDVALIELVEPDARLAQGGCHRRHHGAALQQAVAAQQRDAAAALEVVPELQRAHGQAHVVGVGVREAERARVVARAAEIVPDGVLLDQGHRPAALGEHARRCGAHGAGAHHDGRAHGAPCASAETASSRSACTTSAT